MIDDEYVDNNAYFKNVIITAILVIIAVVLGVFALTRTEFFQNTGTELVSEYTPNTYVDIDVEVAKKSIGAKKHLVYNTESYTVYYSRANKDGTLKPFTKDGTFYYYDEGSNTIKPY